MISQQSLILKKRLHEKADDIILIKHTHARNLEAIRRSQGSYSFRGETSTERQARFTDEIHRRSM
jgi:hypothetical protein